MKTISAYLGLFILMVFIGGALAMLIPQSSVASEGCSEVPESYCWGSCIYFDEPLYLFTQNCNGLCFPYVNQREIWVAGARCEGTLCWTFYGCYTP